VDPSRGGIVVHLAPAAPPLSGGIVIHSGHCGQVRTRWRRGEEQLVQSDHRAADGRHDRGTCRLPRGNLDARRPDGHASQACPWAASCRPWGETRIAFARPERQGSPRCARRSAALTPGSLRLESDQEGRWPSSPIREVRSPWCATWSRCPGAGRYRSVALNAQSADSDHERRVDQYPAAARELISPRSGSRSRREVDPS
jgi:hypothetical protein